MGLIHEHQRPDRDDYIDIITDNVVPWMMPQFVKYKLTDVDILNTTYDYTSIMHYGLTVSTS